MQKKTKHQRTSFINRWTRHIGYVKSARVCQNFLWKYSMWNFQMPGQKRYPSQLTTTRLGSHFKAATSEPPETSRPRKNKHPLQVKAVKQWAHMRTKQKPQQQHIVLHFILGIYGSVVFSVFCHLCVKYLEGRNQCNGPPNFGCTKLQFPRTQWSMSDPALVAPKIWERKCFRNISTSAMKQITTTRFP